MTENQALPGVGIELGGKEYQLIFTLYAFAKLKKVAQINALKGEVDFMDPSHLLYFLWAGLISNHPEFDGDLIDGKPDKSLSSALRTLGAQLTLQKMGEIGKSVREAFSEATTIPDEPEAEGGKKKEKKA